MSGSFSQIQSHFMIGFFFSLFDSSQEVEQPSSEATVSAVGEGGEDEPDDGGQPSLEEALAQLGLTSLTEKFHQEEIDFDSLVSVMIIL